MNTKENQTVVIYRTFHSGDVIALFPLEPSDNYGHHCMSYQHIGQHGGASLDLCRAGTRPSTPDEIAPLREELERIGYSLREVKRVPSNAFQIRKSKLSLSVGSIKLAVSDLYADLLAAINAGNLALAQSLANSINAGI